jgi:hypothetical protein
MRYTVNGYDVYRTRSEAEAEAARIFRTTGKVVSVEERKPTVVRYDARGIPLLAGVRYRRDVLSNSNYEHNEPIDPEE